MRGERFLKSSDPKFKGQLKDRLKELENFPDLKMDFAKISGEEDTYRIRSGKYRALFKVYEDEKLIVVVKIDHRKRIYK